MARDAGEPCIYNQAGAVLHEAMADEAQLSPPCPALLVEHGVGISAARIGGVRAPLVPEIDRCIAAIATVASGIASPTAILPRAEALHTRPCLDQRAINAEMLAREQLAHARLVQDRAKEPGGAFTRQQPIAVLGKGRVIPHRLVHAQSHEPAEARP